MADVFMHYVSPKLAARRYINKGGYGIFADTFVSSGELLVVWGGNVVTGEQFAQLSPREKMHSIQIEENLYQVPSRPEPEPGDFINHSCTPNAGLSSSISLVAMRDIEIGEEICFDYAMSDGSPYDEFDCACASLHCRGRVTGDDWRLPKLQARYAGYFSPYLQRRIDGLQKPKSQNGYHHLNTFTAR